jgi:hypothetical protein
MISYTQFVTDFPEFAVSATYPQSAFNFYQNFATIMLTAVWGQPATSGQPNTLYDIGMEMFIAHNLALEAMNQKAAATGGIPGLSTGIASSEGAGPVNISYDTTSAIELDAGHWNLTTYGTRFVQMARMLGSAPMYIGPAGCVPPNSGPGWIGPPPWPGWFSS